MTETLSRDTTTRVSVKRRKRSRIADDGDLAPSLESSKQMHKSIRKLSAADRCIPNLPRAMRKFVSDSEALQSDPEVHRDSWMPIDVAVIRKVVRIDATDVHPPRQRSILEDARRLDKLGRIDAALDIVFDRVDELLLEGDFEKVDQEISRIRETDFSAELLLGILTVTLPAKENLPGRPDLYSRIKQWLESYSELEDGLLVGLE
jgi:hypothetical protein